ncbi:MAG TPA: carboxypeptidase-like regulatory domain-containing protein, partial [Terriglobales bacterium]|nr:carboxypeptidase-like regulatory domain-containing protein [Terriglobales bacterium]
GAPAVRADVGLVSKGAQLRLKPSGIADEMNRGVAALVTDAQGQFRLPADESITRVVAVTPEGYAEAMPAALASNPTLALQPWGKLEGTWLSGSKSNLTRELFLQFPGNDINTFGFSFEDYIVKTDAQGHFSFPSVPPGRLELIQLVPAGNGARAHEPVQEVEIKAGETTTVTIGGSGYTVTARVLWPEGTSGTQRRLMAYVRTVPPPALAQAMNDPQAASGLQDSPEAKTYASSARHFTMALSEGDALQSDNIPAGDYMVWIMTMPDSAPAPGAPQQTMCSGTVQFTVPAEPATGMIDLGTIALKAPPARN